MDLRDMSITSNWLTLNWVNARLEEAERGDYSMSKIMLDYIVDKQIEQPFLEQHPEICRKFTRIMIKGLQKKDAWPC